ncbi:MAG: DNA-processing protein DprA, partial [Halocynthiibacter sp.]
MAEDLFPTHPTFQLPLTDEDRLSWLRLIRSRRVGVATFFRLMQEYGSAAEALNALPDIARNAGVSAYSVCPESVARAEIAAAGKSAARLLCYGTPEYPAALMDIPDAPPVLWARGNLAILQRPMIAIVGARNASSLGTRMTRTLVGGLTDAGFSVV